jgi:hypothetical protein
VLAAQGYFGNHRRRRTHCSGAPVPNAKVTVSNVDRNQVRDISTDLGGNYDRSHAPQNSYNWHEGEYGPATLDPTQVFILNCVYTIAFSRTGWLAYVRKGWQVSGITTYYTGSPFTVTTSVVDPAGLGIRGASYAGPRPGMSTAIPTKYSAHRGRIGQHLLLCHRTRRPGPPR